MSHGMPVNVPMAFVHRDTMADMKYETQRLILARSVWDLGDAVDTSEEDWVAVKGLI